MAGERDERTPRPPVGCTCTVTRLWLRTVPRRPTLRAAKPRSFEMLLPRFLVIWRLPELVKCAFDDASWVPMSYALVHVFDYDNNTLRLPSVADPSGATARPLSSSTLCINFRDAPAYAHRTSTVFFTHRQQPPKLRPSYCTVCTSNVSPTCFYCIIRLFWRTNYSRLASTCTLPCLLHILLAPLTISPISDAFHVKRRDPRAHRARECTLDRLLQRATFRRGPLRRRGRPH